MWKRLAWLAAVLPALALAVEPVLLDGAGATAPLPLYARWFAAFGEAYPNLRFNYRPLGSGEGLHALANAAADFAACDGPPGDEELSEAGDVVLFPTAVGAVAVTYHAPVTGLRLTPETLAGLFLGRIRSWNDPALARDNPGVALPDLPVTVVHREDGSGITAVFTDYLAKVSPDWKAAVGAGRSVPWPAGQGAVGNEGVGAYVQRQPGAVGYVELSFAQEHRLPLARLRNRAGTFVDPSLDSIAAAAAGVELPPGLRVSLTDPPAKEAWPIAAYTYLVVRRDQGDAVKGPVLVSFLWWVTHEGQQLVPSLGWVPLPEPVVKEVEGELGTLTVTGTRASFGSR